MSMRHVAAVLCILSGVLFYARRAPADDKTSLPTTSGANQAGDINCSSNPDSSSNRDEGDFAFNNCDGSDQPKWRWIGGVEATYLDPRFHASGNEFSEPLLRQVDPGWSAAPRIWLGVENNNGWGARVRYWQLGDEQTKFVITNIQSGFEYDVAQTLKMYDIDAEVTNRFELGDWDLLASFGGRFASIQRLVAEHILDITSPSGSFLFGFNNRTAGGGITGSVEMSRPIGIGAWEVFGLFRGSSVWGNTDATAIDHDIIGALKVGWRIDSDLTIWETQAGLQCLKHVDWCAGAIFARCAFEYQSWNWFVPGGVPRGSVIFDPGADLYGVAFAVGFTR